MSTAFSEPRLPGSRFQEPAPKQFESPADQGQVIVGDIGKPGLHRLSLISGEELSSRVRFRSGPFSVTASRKTATLLINGQALLIRNSGPLNIATAGKNDGQPGPGCGGMGVLVPASNLFLVEVRGHGDGKPRRLKNLSVQALAASLVFQTHSTKPSRR